MVPKSKISSVIFYLIFNQDGEVNVLKEISYSNHPDRLFTTKIYDCFLTENNIIMILEFCPDGNLEQIITQRGAIPEN